MGTRMQVEAARKRIQELMLVTGIRHNIWKNATKGSTETKCTFWGKKKLGFKVKLRNSYPHVVNVSPGDQAEEKGMRVGDMIIGINNNMLDKQESYNSFVTLLRRAKRPFVLNILREPHGLVSTDYQFSVQCRVSNNNDLGFELADENYAQYVVGKVDLRSAVHQQGVRPGDILEGINGTPFPGALSVDDIMSIICNHTDKPFELDFCREQQPSHGNHPKPAPTSRVQVPPKPVLKDQRREGRNPNKKTVMFSEGNAAPAQSFHREPVTQSKESTGSTAHRPSSSSAWEHHQHHNHYR